jgi:serine/threonine-protein kinase
MPLQSGTRLGPYQIVNSLGAGGMGEVYRARDTKLNRDVALKVLPALFVRDPERLSRFERESHLLASLNHANIAQVYGVLDEPPVLVMELVDGEDLAARLTRGPVPVGEALEIGRQVADALQAAHDRGIVHRDLKPANIKVRDDGAVKVLDFGLAKAIQATAPEMEASAARMMNSPTFTSPAMTQAGVILGTAAYMAPEQAKGKPVDRGSDLWSFGAVLYEMLTGTPAFGGETVTDMLAAIVTRDPDWTKLPAATPAGVVRLLKRCLERDRRRRLADAGEARYQLEEAFAIPPTSPTSPRGAAIGWRVLPWAVGAVAVGWAIMLAPRREPPPNAVGRYSYEIPANAVLLLTSRPAVALSPNGSTLVFAATSKGVDRLYIRRSNAFEASPMTGTDGGSHPVFSPDGRWIAFITSTKLCKVAVDGGPVMTLADVNDARGLSWDTDETITYTPKVSTGVFQVPAAGGSPVQVTIPKEGEQRTHRWAQQLPGDAGVMYTVGDFSNPDDYENATVEVFTPKRGERRRILSAAAMARYLPTGHLLFLRGTTIHVVQFDLRTLQVKGTPIPLLQDVAIDGTTGAAHFAASASGSLAYISAGGESAALRPMEVDRNGRSTPLPLPLGLYSDIAVSPDGRQVAYVLASGGGRDIWLYNRARKAQARMTFGGQNVTPLWTRDSSMVYYVARHQDSRGSTIMRRPSDGSRDAESILAFPKNLIYLDYLKDDQRKAVIEIVETGVSAADIHEVELNAAAKPAALLVTPFVEYCARFSPDGRWMAYVGMESGRAEVYVRHATAAGGRWQVSTAGGEEPKWSPDGRQLYFRAGNLLMSSSIGTGASFEAGVPIQLFTGVYNLRNESGLSYDVDPATGGFVMVRVGDEAAGVNSLRLITGWFDEVRAATSK